MPKDSTGLFGAGEAIMTNLTLMLGIELGTSRMSGSALQLLIHLSVLGVIFFWTKKKFFFYPNKFSHCGFKAYTSTLPEIIK